MNTSIKQTIDNLLSSVPEDKASYDDLHGWRNAVHSFNLKVDQAIRDISKEIGIKVELPSHIPEMYREPLQRAVEAFELKAEEFWAMNLLRKYIIEDLEMPHLLTVKVEFDNEKKPSDRQGETDFEEIEKGIITVRFFRRRFEERSPLVIALNHHRENNLILADVWEVVTHEFVHVLVPAYVSGRKVFYHGNLFQKVEERLQTMTGLSKEWLDFEHYKLIIGEPMMFLDYYNELKAVRETLKKHLRKKLY